MHGMRAVVPPKLQQPVLEDIQQGHPGIVRSKDLARSYEWWSSVEKDLENQAMHCRSRLQQRNMPQKAPLNPWSWPTQPWSRVHIDFADPFRIRMLLVVDAHSKWPEADVMSSASAQAKIADLRELFARNGTPETIVSNNGAQFTLSELKAFMKEHAVRQVFNSADHPTSSQLAERFVHTLKNTRREGGKGPVTESLDETLPTFLMAVSEHAACDDTRDTILSLSWSSIAHSFGRTAARFTAYYQHKSVPANDAAM